MKTLPDSRAFASESTQGLTKREYFAIKIMEAMVSSRKDGISREMFNKFVKMSVFSAQELIRELNNENDEEF